MGCKTLVPVLMLEKHATYAILTTTKTEKKSTKLPRQIKQTRRKRNPTKSIPYRYAIPFVLM